MQKNNAKLMLLNCTCTVSVWNNGTIRDAVTLLSILPSSGCRGTVGRTRRTRRRHVRRHIRPIHRRILLAAAYPAIIICSVYIKIKSAAQKLREAAKKSFF